MNRDVQDRAREHLGKALAYTEPEWREIMAHVRAAYDLLRSDEQRARGDRTW